MSNALISRVAASSLPPPPSLVAYVLANRTNSVTGQCNPSVATIQRETGLPRPDADDFGELLESVPASDPFWREIPNFDSTFV